MVSATEKGCDEPAIKDQMQKLRFAVSRNQNLASALITDGELGWKNYRLIYEQLWDKGTVPTNTQCSSGLCPRVVTVKIPLADFRKARNSVNTYQQAAGNMNRINMDLSQAMEELEELIELCE